MTEKELKAKADELSKREKILEQQSTQLKEQEYQMKLGISNLLKKRFAEYKQTFDKKLADILEKEKHLDAREAKINADELKLKNELTDELQKIKEEKLNEITENNKKIISSKQNLLQKFNAYMDEQTLKVQKNFDALLLAHQERIATETEKIKELQFKRSDALMDIKKECDEYREKLLATAREEINNKYKELYIEKENLAREKQNYENDLEEFELEKAKLEERTKYIAERENNFKEELENSIPAFKESLDKELNDKEEELKRLRERISRYSNAENLYNDIAARVGSDPQALLKKLDDKDFELSRLREEIALRPSEDLKIKYAELESKAGNIEEREKKLKDYEEKYIEALEETPRIRAENSRLEKEVNQLRAENDRLTAAYETPKNREERIAVIEKGLEEFENKQLKEENNIKELDWLDDIDNKIKDFGLVFPKRILYAFHTALKCSEISPLTVLAGVSGTGKSELPRLYSHFGGINFLSLPVQPNWDSQEAMLGFFNSIDNRFDAQDVLRLLVQTQKNDVLKEAMTLILLDEMNLANVELYFSDFLSKLESRRGCDDDNIPSIGVKIGSGLEDYQIPLGRNVLWAGTMNQDETTKTLSDKVLDRGIVINFPSPKELKSRKIKAKLQPRANMLRRENWNTWINKNVLEPEIINPYKKIIEEINKELNKTGRALGHRVWQSIEAYMANYPTFIYSNETEQKRELKKAFEDQLVQKVMPKLRGLETRGTQGDCLKRIQEKISDYNLDEDFKNAMNLGYGQFMWCTSNYIYQDEKETPNEVDPNTKIKNAKKQNQKNKDLKRKG
ncbi:MAG: hypothetical protein P1P64_04335 [Treponemataceae bacterium]